MLARLLQLDDVRQINSPEKVASLFHKIGYDTAAKQLDVDDLELPARSAEVVGDSYLIADHQRGSESLQVLLFQLHKDEWVTPSVASNRMRSIAQSLCRRPSNYLLLGTKDYDQLMLVNPRKSFDADLNLKVSIRKLLIDRANPTNYDRDRLEVIAARSFSPQELYKVQCEAFDVEKLTKEFYKGYREIFEVLQRVIKTNNPHSYFNDSNRLHQFSQRLLGRIMFLYFLQKKEFLAGDRNFLKTQYSKLRSDLEDTDFYAQVLEPLFFEMLNKQRPNMESPWGKIPYLNGGLFDRDYGLGVIDSAGVETPPQIKLPNLLFDPSGEKGILKFFNSYNFTVSENVQGDEDVAVDPEMLGKVFENMLAAEERGQSGTFYTPRPIVQFMCVESLSRYLADETGMDLEAVKKLTEFDPESPDQDINQLITKEQAKKLKKALDSVKVCDPAVGSGAFPMGMMQVILSVKQAIAHREGVTIKRGSLTMSEWKRDIIANNLYGVDIKPEAVEIAKLRMWLSLVVDIPSLEDVEPLPNLDYKLMCGDSLISTINGEQLIPDPTKDQQIMLNVTPIQSAIQPLIDLKHQYFEAHADERKILRGKILEAEKNVFLVALDDRRRYWQTQQHHLEEDIQRMKKASKTQQKKYKEITDKLTELDKLAADVEKGMRSLNFFQWHLHFNEVFQQQGGFDIVVGNPPYVRADVGGRNLVLRQTIEASDDYETLWEKWDLYVAFIERGYKLLSANGITSMIVSDAYCHSKYAQKSQKWFLKNSRIIRLDFLSKLQFFEAKVKNIIYFFQKADGINNKPKRLVHENKLGDIKVLSTNKQKELNYRTFFPENTEVKQFSNPTILLKDVCYITVGMVVHANEKIAKGAFELKDLVSDSKDRLHPKPFVEGKHLARWLPSLNKWLEWGTSRAPGMFRRPTFPELYNVSEKLISVDMAAGAKKLRVVYDNQQLYHNHSAWSFIPWHSLSNIRNKSIKKSARYCDEKPYRSDLPKREDLEENSRRFNIKFLLAVMNSMIAYDFLKANRRSNIHLYPDDWKKLPIPNVSIEEQQPIVELVERIFLMKQTDSSVDISSLETEIDDRVAHLYGLTLQKIKITKGEQN
ncbi:MAG: Eco57I restriction-modification methylase domain-containing protein [Rivularia sp. (in: cyanobacteria)]